ncbi:MAG: cysteine desulfurase [Bdellovibrionales bacterium]|nr:cysteine desulfurase [Bdellovibrionales bacterium]
MSYNVEKFREQFPMLSQKVNGEPFVYLDNAASSLKPVSVAERLYKYYTSETANIHRGAHYFSRLGTEHYEGVRDKVKTLINAAAREEIVFTRGTTDSINLVMYSYGLKEIQKGDIILLSPFEHHSNIIPWKMLEERTGCKIEVLPFGMDGRLSQDALKSYEDQPVKMISLVLYSNVTGVRLDVEPVIEWSKKKKAITFIDAAQAMLTEAIDVQKMDCDLLTFSGHKMFAPYGVGVLYGKKAFLDGLSPFEGGGSMISQVSWESVVYQDTPHKFEAGTPNISSVLGLGEAIDFMKKYDLSDWNAHEKALILRLEKELSQYPSVTLYGPSISEVRKSAVLSFNWKGAHSSDVGEILDQSGVAVRAGHLCAQPMMKMLEVPGTVRVSLAPYNSEQDIELFLKAFKKVEGLL